MSDDEFEAENGVVDDGGENNHIEEKIPDNGADQEPLEKLTNDTNHHQAIEKDDDEDFLNLDEEPEEKSVSTPKKKKTGQSKQNTPAKTPTKTSFKTPTKTPTRMTPRNPGKSPTKTPSPGGSRTDFSPHISDQASSIKRSGNVFDSLYNDAIARRERHKKSKEKVEEEARAQARSPTVSKYANKTARTRNVFEALYADAVTRRENTQKKRDSLGN